MTRAEVYQKLKSLPEVELLAMLIFANLTHDQILEALMSVADDCQINEALGRVRKEYRITK